MRLRTSTMKIYSPILFSVAPKVRTVKIEKFKVLFVLPLFFLYSYLLVTPYTEGDQQHYRALYEAFKSVSAFEALLIASNMVASQGEPITTYLLWSGAKLGIDKDIFISIINTGLLMGVYLLGKQHRVGSFVLFLLLTNFYIIVLMTATERLKVAFLFLVWAGIATGIKRYTLLILSPLAHLSAFLFLPSLLLAAISNDLKKAYLKLRIRKRIIYLLFFSLFVLLVLLFFLFDSIEDKAGVYLGPYPTHLLQISLLSILSLTAAKDKFRMLLTLIPGFPLVYLLAGGRVNIIFACLAIYLLIIEHKVRNHLVVLLLVYFSLKSIPFVIDIYLYGSGFARVEQLVD